MVALTWPVTFVMWNQTNESYWEIAINKSVRQIIIHVYNVHLRPENRVNNEIANRLGKCICVHVMVNSDGQLDGCRTAMETNLRAYLEARSRSD